MLLLLLSCLVGIGSVQGIYWSPAAIEIAQIENDLYNYLFNNSGYDPTIRPVDTSDGKTSVTLDIAIAQIVEINTKEQTMQLNCWRRLYWIDHRLRWNHLVNSTLSKVSFMMTKRADVWVPDTMMIKDIRFNFRSEEVYFTTMYSNGKMFMSVPIPYETLCHLNIKSFPYDDHLCKLKLGSWSYDENALDLQPKRDKADLGYYISNNEFWLISAASERVIVSRPGTTNKYVEIHYNLKIRRKPLFYHFNLVLPSLFLLVVVLFSFMLPVESKERTSFAVTILLALTVFLELMEEHTPTQSDNVPLMVEFIMIIVFLSSFITLGNIVVVIIHFNGLQGDPMGTWFRKVVLDWLATVVFLKKWAAQHKLELGPGKTTKAVEATSNMISQVQPIQQQKLKQHQQTTNMITVEPASPEGSQSEITSIQDMTLDQLENYINDDSKPKTLSANPGRSRHSSGGRPPSVRTPMSRQELAALGNDKSRPPIFRSMDAIEGRLDYITSFAEEKRLRNWINTEWEVAAVIIDRLLFVLFCFISMLVTILYLAVLPPNKGAEPGFM